jgi:enoyl-CoA hydratase/carnithine racemase
MGPFKDIAVERTGNVALVEIRRPPNNFFDIALIHEIAAALEALDADGGCRATVLASQGKVFCAGANFGDGGSLDAQGRRPGEQSQGVGHLYMQAVRLFRIKKPIIAAVHGPAVGGGLGLAMVADFRVACPEARFVANFTRLGFHPGFGLSVTLPRAIGAQNAALMFYTSRRVTGTDAHAMGLADVLVPQDEVRSAALALAAEIAENAPLGVLSTRATMRGDLADRVMKATEHELAEQSRLRQTDDFKEGVKAMAERRVPSFTGR